MSLAEDVYLHQDKSVLFFFNLSFLTYCCFFICDMIELNLHVNFPFFFISETSLSLPFPNRHILPGLKILQVFL